MLSRVGNECRRRTQGCSSITKLQLALFLLFLSYMFLEGEDSSVSPVIHSGVLHTTISLLTYEDLFPIHTSVLLTTITKTMEKEMQAPSPHIILPQNPDTMKKGLWRRRKIIN